MKVNETTKVAPLPWSLELREVPSPTGKPCKTRKTVFVDANGHIVRHTMANMRFILDCVSNSEECKVAEFEAEREEIAKNEIMYP